MSNDTVITSGTPSAPQPRLARAFSAIGLEQRMLLDAAAVSTMAESIAAADDTSLTADDGTTTDILGAVVDMAAQTNSARDAVFIDVGIKDYQKLLQDISPDAEVFFIDPSQDGLQQMLDALAGSSDYRSIQIYSHGDVGEIYLGSTILNNDTLASNANALAALGTYLTEDGDLLLFGCDVAGDTNGRAFVDALALITGADVAASADQTGSASAASNWILEYNAGEVTAQTVIDQRVQELFDSNLALGWTNVGYGLLKTNTAANDQFGVSVAVADTTGWIAAGSNAQGEVYTYRPIGDGNYREYVVVTAAPSVSATYSTNTATGVITVTQTAHGLTVGRSVSLDFTTGGADPKLDAQYTVATVVDANNYTVVPAGLSGTFTQSVPPGTITVTSTAHGLANSSTVYLNFDGGLYDKAYVVTVTGPDTFTVPNSPITTATYTVPGGASSTTIEVTMNSHGLAVGNKVYLNFITGLATPDDGTYSVSSVTNANAFRITGPVSRDIDTTEEVDVSLASGSLKIVPGGTGNVTVTPPANGGAASVDIDGNFLIVGYKDLNKAYIYEYVAATDSWVNRTGTGLVGTGSFGFDVAIQAEGTSYRAVVGAPQYNSGVVGQGGAYTYYSTNSGSTWTAGVVLSTADGRFDSVLNFGTAVAIDGSDVVVGAPGWGFQSSSYNGNTNHNNVGRAYVYNWTGTGAINDAVIDATLQPNGLPAVDAAGWATDSFAAGNPDDAQFGTAVDVSVNGTTQRVIVGAPNEGGNGEAYTWVNTAAPPGTWGGMINIVPGLAAGDKFGYSVAIDAYTNRIAVGAYGVSTEAGSVMMYTAAAGALDTTFATVQAGSRYGYGVALARDFVAVGTPWYDRDGIGSDKNGYVDLRMFNQAPLAANDSAATTESASVTVDVLANDSDPNTAIFDPITISSVTSPSKGLASVVNGKVVYNPNGDYEYLRAGQTAVENITYTIRDMTGTTATATIAVTVNGQNDPVLAGTAISTQTGNAGGAADVIFTAANPISSLTLAQLGAFTDLDIGDTYTYNFSNGTTSVTLDAVGYPGDAAKRLAFTINNSTGAVTFNPGVALIGLSYNVTLRIGDGASTVDISFTVDIARANAAPTATAGTLALTAYEDNIKPGTYAQSGTTTITVTSTGHGLANGSTVSLDFLTGTASDSSFAITVVDANTFTVVDAVSRTTSGDVFHSVPANVSITAQFADADAAPPETLAYSLIGTQAGTYSRNTAGVITVTSTAHGLAVGNFVTLDFTSGTAVDAKFNVATVVDANTFTITDGTTTSTSGNVVHTKATGAPSFVTVNASTGQLLYAASNNDVPVPAAPFAFAVRVTDQYGQVADKFISLTLTPTNDAPGLSNEVVDAQASIGWQYANIAPGALYSGTYTQTATVVTVTTSVAHGLATGMTATLDFITGNAANADADFTITVTSTTQFTVNLNGTANSTANNVTVAPRGALLQLPIAYAGTYSHAGTTATITTTTAHGLVPGATVTLDYTSGLGIDTTYTVLAVTSTTVFTVTEADAIGTGNVTAVSGITTKPLFTDTDRPTPDTFTMSATLANGTVLDGGSAAVSAGVGWLRFDGATGRFYTVGAITGSTSTVIPIKVTVLDNGTPKLANSYFFDITLVPAPGSAGYVVGSSPPIAAPATNPNVGYAQAGYAVAISEDGLWMAVGEPGYDDTVGTDTEDRHGRVAIYSWSGTAWNAPTYLEVDALGSGSRFGFSLDWNAGATVLAVGAPGANSGAGAVYTWSRATTGTAWTSTTAANTTYTTAAALVAGDNLGYAVALDRAGAQLIVGAPGDDGQGPNAGAVYLYNVGTAAQVDKAVALLDPAYSGVAAETAGSLQDRFGTSVDFDGDLIAVGAPLDSTGGLSVNGSVTLFTVVGADANSLNGAFRKFAGAAAYDQYGADVAFDLYRAAAADAADSSITLVVGAPGSDIRAADAGAVYSYRNPIASPLAAVPTQANLDAIAPLVIRNGLNVVVNTGVLTAYDGAAYQNFGLSVDVDAQNLAADLANDVANNGIRMIVGSSLNGTAPGVAYIFRDWSSVAGNGWVGQKYLQTNNGLATVPAGNQFGWDVAISNAPTSAFNAAYAVAANAGRVVVGAPATEISRTGTYNQPANNAIVTVTFTSHGLTAGMLVSLDFLTGLGMDDTYLVRNPAANTFEVTANRTQTAVTNGNVIFSTMGTQGAAYTASTAGAAMETAPAALSMVVDKTLAPLSFVVGLPPGTTPAFRSLDIDKTWAGSASPVAGIGRVHLFDEERDLRVVPASSLAELSLAVTAGDGERNIGVGTDTRTAPDANDPGFDTLLFLLQTGANAGAALDGQDVDADSDVETGTETEAPIPAEQDQPVDTALLNTAVLSRQLQQLGMRHQIQTNDLLHRLAALTG